MADEEHTQDPVDEDVAQDREPAAADTERPRQEELTVLLAQIRDELARGNDRAAAREKVIDQLHEQNQQLRRGEYRQLLRPVSTDLQVLRNELLRQAGNLPDLTPQDMAALLKSYADSVELALERAGVRVVKAVPGTRFEPARHRVVAVRDAGSAADDGIVAAVHADGYADAESGRVLTQAAVDVYRWNEPSDVEQS